MARCIHRWDTIGLLVIVVRGCLHVVRKVHCLRSRPSLGVVRDGLCSWRVYVVATLVLISVSLILWMLFHLMGAGCNLWWELGHQWWTKEAICYLCDIDILVTPYIGISLVILGRGDREILVLAVLGPSKRDFHLATLTDKGLCVFIPRWHRS